MDIKLKNEIESIIDEYITKNTDFEIASIENHFSGIDRIYYRIKEVLDEYVKSGVIGKYFRITCNNCYKGSTDIGILTSIDKDYICDNCKETYSIRNSRYKYMYRVI